MTSRPLSPHIQVYRPQLTSALSIMHRISGVALSVGSLVLLYWLAAAASGPAAYASAQAVLGSFIVQLMLVGWSWAFFYHLCNGVRHLAWDAGVGFEIKQAYASGYAVMVGSTALTVLVWICIVAQSGGGQ